MVSSSSPSSSILTTSLLFCLSLCSNKVIGGDVYLEINQDPNKREAILHQSVESISKSNPVFIKSNVPVQLLQYQHNFYNNDRLIYPGDAVVFFKSECDSDESLRQFQPNVIVDTFSPSLDEDTVLYLNVENSFVSRKVSDEMPPPSSFMAEWDTYDRVCEGGREDFFEGRPIGRPIEEEEGVGEGEGGEKESAFERPEPNDNSFVDEVSSFIASRIRGRNQNIDEEIDTIEKKPNRVQLLGDFIKNRQEENDNDKKSGCSIVAEILYDSCQHDLSISAPQIQIFEHDIIEHIVETPNPNQQCNIIKTGLLSFGGEPKLVNGTRRAYKEGKTDLQLCSQVVIGRPFVDVNGDLVQAEAHVVDETQWSLPQNMEQSSQDENEYETKNEIENEMENDIENEHELQAQGADWTNRALGEHSSIASFAAFSIALMTNNAPPDLIQDALKAALDEFRHARTSFDMASHLTNQVLSPGPLPPTTHKFDQDLTSLALGAAKEGCVDETLSALIAAAEVVEISEFGLDLPFEWKEKVSIITKEEAQHSALAWRTIHWVCSVDHAACEDVTQYFVTEANDRARQRIHMSDMSPELAVLVETEWTRIFDALLPVATAQKSFGGFDYGSRKGFISNIADKIVFYFTEATKVKESPETEDLVSIQFK